MKINNFSVLGWMHFTPGTYYKFVALVRRKDYKGSGVKLPLSTEERGEVFIRQWFIDSFESLEKYKEDMIGLCDATGARLYMTVDRKSTTKTILSMQEQLTGYIKQLVYNPQAPISIRKLSKFSASASQLAECSDGQKYWLFDIDDKENWYDISHIFSKLLVKDASFVTPNGLHILVKRNFDAHKWLEVHTREGAPLHQYSGVISVKENALTLVYFNKGE